MRSLIREKRSQKLTIGFVPTMGALHNGHLTLVRTAKEKSDLVICSIFVNPTQFNNPKDLIKYPRTEKADCNLLSSEGCDVVFMPTVDEMYPTEKENLAMSFGNLELTMEGAHRPGHFSGVGLVVSKFFNMVQPDLAFFGSKDLQQLAVVKKLVLDLAFPIEIVSVDTVREDSGLAMSSRNQLLSVKQKQDAAIIFRVLSDCRRAIRLGDDVQTSKERAFSILNSQDFIKVEYLEVVVSDTMDIIHTTKLETMNYSICCAAMVHGVRLIDNIKI
ncbi:MAG: pantoate--beta-alanine ligase [Reichenbachiella sp.]